MIASVNRALPTVRLSRHYSYVTARTRGATPPPFRSYQIANKFDVTALVVVVPKDKLEVKGPVKKWKGTADSGNAVWRWFCEECGSPIAHDPDAAPEIIALKGGSLDTELKKDLKPVSY